MSRQHIAAINCFVCTGEILLKPLSPQQNFVAATCRKKSNQAEFVLLVVATKFCCRDKDLHKNSPVHMKRFVHCDVLLQLVACPVDTVTCHHDLLLQLVT